MKILISDDIRDNPIWSEMAVVGNRVLQAELGFYGDDAVVRWEFATDRDYRPGFRLTGGSGQPVLFIRMVDFRDADGVRTRIEEFAQEFRELRSGVLSGDCDGDQAGSAGL